MDILLINANPVVSRLIALCTRDMRYHLEEVSVAIEAKKTHYDIVFVDEDSFSVATGSFLDSLDAGKKIFFSSSHENFPAGFERVIHKPFLPSQIIEILKDTQESEDPMLGLKSMAANEDEKSIAADKEKRSWLFPLTAAEDDESLEVGDDKVPNQEDTEVLSESTDSVLDAAEIEKIKALLEMDESEDKAAEELSDPEVLSDDEYEARKIEAIKEDLISQGLEIVDEKTFVEELEIKDGGLTRQKSKNKPKKSKALTLEELEMLEMMFAYTIRKRKPKKLRKLLKGKRVKLKLKDPL